MTVGLYCFNIVTLIINGSIFMQLPLVLYRSGMGKGGGAEKHAGYLELRLRYGWMFGGGGEKLRNSERSWSLRMKNRLRGKKRGCR